MVKGTMWVTGLRLAVIVLLVGAFSFPAAAEETLLFRARRDGQPFSGLKKEDLQLTVDGVDCQITALAEVRRKLDATGTAKPRLVTLVFNVSDFKLDLAPAVDFVFAKVLRANDRLMVHSNNFFLADHVVASLQSEKKRLLQIIDLEKRKYKVLYQSVRFQLTDLLNSTARMIEGQTEEDAGFATPEWNRQGVYPEAIRRNFIHIIVQTVQSYKKFFLNLGAEQFRRLAGYLSLQDAEKWGFVFYQHPNFYVPEPQSVLAAYLSPSELFKKMYDELYVADTLNAVAIGKAFIGSGQWSTLLLTPLDRIPLAVGSAKGALRLDRAKIASEGERVFPQISLSNGGVTGETGKFAEFLKKVEEHEDLFYLLTHAGGSASPPRQVRLTASVPCELVYDDQKRPLLSDGQGQTAAAGPRIASLELKETLLRIRLDAPPPAAAGGEERKVLVNVQLNDERMDMVLNKSFETGTASAIEVTFPALSKGTYDLVVEATDVATGKNDLALLLFSVSKKGIHF